LHRAAARRFVRDAARRPLTGPDGGPSLREGSLWCSPSGAGVQTRPFRPQTSTPGRAVRGCPRSAALLGRADRPGERSSIGIADRPCATHPRGEVLVGGSSVRRTVADRGQPCLGVCSSGGAQVFWITMARRPADPPTPGSPEPTSSARPASARAVDRYRSPRPVGAAEERSRPGAAAQRAAGRACLRPTGPSLHARPGRRAPQGTLAQQGPAVRPGRAVSVDSAAHSQQGPAVRQGRAVSVDSAAHSQQGPAVRPGRAVSVDSAAHSPRMDQSA